MIQVATVLLVLSIALQSVWAQSTPADVISSEEIVRKLNQSVGRSRGFVKVGEQSSTPSVVFNNILFALDSASLNSSSRAQLDELRKALSTAELRDKTFQISGHTDGRGEAFYNRQLSARRADSVAEYLLLASDRIDLQLDVVGRGEDEPLPNFDPNDSRQRRVEIRISSASKSP